jgi:hypothetical protein
MGISRSPVRFFKLSSLLVGAVRSKRALYYTVVRFALITTTTEYRPIP